MQLEDCYAVGICMVHAELATINHGKCLPIRLHLGFYLSSLEPLVKTGLTRANSDLSHCLLECSDMLHE